MDAKANGGTNSEKNCVACCREINSLLGSMSLKEKIRVILNQKGKFVCPKTAVSKAVSVAKSNPQTPVATTSQYSTVLAELERRGASKPKKVESLKNTMRSVLERTGASVTELHLDSLLEQLQRNGKVQISGTVVSYPG